jgi:signal transduction histidine kinase
MIRAVRLRVQILLAMMLVLFALTATCLLVVRLSVQREIERQSADALAASVRAFKQVEAQQSAELLRTSALLAELPVLKALMTTEHGTTIQDGSAEFWVLSGSDLLVLAQPQGRIMAIHGSGPAPDPEIIERLLLSSMGRERAAWWQVNSELFRVFVRPIIVGTDNDRRTVGLLALGTRMDAATAHQIARFSSTEIVLASGPMAVATTLGERGRAEFMRWLATAADPAESTPASFDGRSYKVAVVDLEVAPSSPIRCYILLPLDSAVAFLDRLNRTIVILGVAAAVLGAALVTLLAARITRPLNKLVKAVRAFGAGDPNYSPEIGGTLEITELAAAFVSMRLKLAESQRRQIEAERLAALGRAASSISHDLRHYLAALVANAEFLHDAPELGFDRTEIYQEIQRASSQMTGLIDSLLEIGREKKVLSIAKGNLADVFRSAAAAVCLIPEHRRRNFEIHVDQKTNSTEGTFDARKLERAFFNLLLNACEATPAGGRIGVVIAANGSRFVCRVWDTGKGVPESIRATLFEPFVSEGKNNGTGLGLAIASKIIHDHRGEIFVAETSSLGTTFEVRLPRHQLVQTEKPAELSV